ncbi:MAG: single-stranded-DNA-specific exonuclease RecJ [Parcubacteria group bacterium]|nr:single-stranded-DNA-specific exonuclease RecJ [Parcubacteria group bacterium]
MHALTDTLLQKRGITDESEREVFLNPDYEKGLHDPFLMKGMERAASRFVHALKNNERIVIFTDYDTDGLPAAVMFHDFFKKVGYENFENYIPHRHAEGFGLSKEAISKCKERGASLLITVDCGITNVDEIAHANTLGVDIIVTDHHLPREGDSKAGEPSEILPEAHAIINPHQKEDEYPFKDLCGCGVAFKFIQAIVEEGKKQSAFEIHDGWEKWLLDMVAIATVSDMVPLVGENRALAYYGLKVLRKSPRPGLMHLFRSLYVDQRFVTEDDIGFVIGPRINAASRMDDPILGFHFLSERDEIKARETLKNLNSLNNKRKGVVAGIIKEATKKIESNGVKDVVVTGNPNWQPGVLGLAANTLSQKYERPVFLWGRLGSEVIRGSCRSNGSIHVVECMREVTEGIFIDFGGHANSGGFSIHNEKIHLFEDALLEAHQKIEKRDPKSRDVIVDAELSLDEVTEQTLSLIERLSPFGTGNPKPVFIFPNIKIDGVQFFGKEKNHMTFIFKNMSGREVPAVSFFADELVSQFKEGDRVALTAHMERNGFRGSRAPRLRVISMTREE